MPADRVPGTAGGGMTRDESLIAFALWCLKEAGWDEPGAYVIGDIDGGSLQEKATEVGLLVRRAHTGEESNGDESCEYVEQPDGSLRCDGGENCDLLLIPDDVRERLPKATP